MATKQENFDNAFIDISCGEFTCACGITYYEHDYFEELEKIECVKIRIRDKSEIVDHVAVMCLMGQEFVHCCKCWEEKSKNVMTFIDSHRHQIAYYLNAEKQRKIEEANQEPHIK